MGSRGKGLAIVAGVTVIVFISTAGRAAEFRSEYISVKTQGTGPDVVLLHGFASSPGVWSRIVKEMSPRYRLHLVHVAGLAGSPAPQKVPDSFLETLRNEIARYMEEGGLRKPILVGHSMGGLIALLVSSQKPATVGRVIVIDSLPFFSLLFNPSATAEQVLPQAKAFEQHIVSLDQEQFAQYTTQSTSILTKTEEKRALLLQWAKRSDRTTYARIFREVMAYDARAELAKISCPVFVVYAFDEAMRVPSTQLEDLYKNAYAKLDSVQIQRVENSFHFIMWDQPARLQKLLDEMLPR